MTRRGSISAVSLKAKAPRGEGQNKDIGVAGKTHAKIKTETNDLQMIVESSKDKSKARPAISETSSSSRSTSQPDLQVPDPIKHLQIANPALNLGRRVSKIHLGHGIVIREKNVGKTGELVASKSITGKEFG